MAATSINGLNRLTHLHLECTYGLTTLNVTLNVLILDNELLSPLGTGFSKI